MNEKDYLKLFSKIFIRVVLTAALLWALYVVRDVILLLFLSIIFTAAMDPAIDWMEKRKIPRPFGVVIIYIGLFLTLGLFVTYIFPPLLGQLKEFTNNLPQFAEKLTSGLSGIEQYARSYGLEWNSHDFIKNIFRTSSETSQIFSTTVGFFSGMISIVVVLSLTFYMSVKEDGLRGFIATFTPVEHHEHVMKLTKKIQSKIGRWMLGQLFLMAIIFVLDFIALSIFGIPYAIVLAFLAGLLEIIPYLGPIISATLAAIVGFLISPITGVIILGVLTLIQQIESHIIVPQMMKKVVGLNPVVVILALLAGVKLGGIMGAILSIPLTTTAGIIIEDYISRKEN